MPDSSAERARQNVSRLLDELQRAIQAFGSASNDEQRFQQLRYIEELAGEVLEAQRRAVTGFEAQRRSFQRSAQPKGLAIVVGHTRAAQGAEGRVPPFPGNQHSEYPWNTDLAHRIKAAAEGEGLSCEIFFRDGGGIEGAYEEVRQMNPQATVELHFNAYNNNARGTETLYKSGNEKSKAWAQALQNRFVELYNRTGGQNRGLKPCNPGDRGHESVSQVHPSALIEPFFGDNADDATLGVERKDKQAQAVVQAFVQHVAVSTVAVASPPRAGVFGAIRNLFSRQS